MRDARRLVNMKKSKVSQEPTRWHTLGRRIREGRLESETALTQPVVGPVSWRLSLIDEYNSDLAEGIKQDDLRQLIPSLVSMF